METLLSLKALQQHYQSKFAELIALHNTKDVKNLETSEYLQIREEWIKAGNDIRAHLEAMNTF